MTGQDVLRPAAGGLKTKIAQFAMGRAGAAFSLARRFWPIPRIGKTFVVTRYDHVREVFLADADFPVPYAEKLDVIMGGEPFFLGMGDTPEYRRDTANMRMAIRREDLPGRLTPQTNEQAEAAVARAPQRIEVVDYTRAITFSVLCEYFGITDPPDGDLRVWSTRLFEFQFADAGNDPSLRAEVDRMAPALRAHIDRIIGERRATRDAKDDVLGRCLALQAEGKPGFSDTQIRSALIGFLVGGLPQPPMVVPHALEQLLRRPRELEAAAAAARSGDDRLLGQFVFEALRFDPLGPALMRKVSRSRVIAAGTPYAVMVPEGANMIVAFSSAMMDERRVFEPRRFQALRPSSDYMHFGYGLHTCFGIHINHALLPLMLKPLLRRANLRRAPGRAGRLVKRGAFAASLWVEWDAAGSNP
jgi:cytochrome P450